MTRPLRALNLLLAVIALALVALIVRESLKPVGASGPTRAPAATGPAPGPVVPPARSAAPAPGGDSVIVSRNVFSPTRTESAVPPPTATAPPLPKPNLYGIVLRDGAPIAYLEDPTTKRIAGYRVGDSVAGGTLQQITEDHVVLVRPEGQVNVGLHDPGRPRPAPPVTPPTPAAQPPAFPTPPTATAAPPTPGRSNLPPNLLRRIPQPPVNVPQ